MAIASTLVMALAHELNRGAGTKLERNRGRGVTDLFFSATEFPRTSFIHAASPLPRSGTYGFSGGGIMHPVTRMLARSRSPTDMFDRWSVAPGERVVSWIRAWCPYWTMATLVRGVDKLTYLARKT
uniref:Uncharacterized protein n=1 Tax=Oryza brachyantha TaxID=4533 RepID=J3M524_ORYBR